MRIGAREAGAAVIPAHAATFYAAEPSILYNLRYGNFEAPHAAVIDAARRTGVDVFVAKLPQGYDTELGSAGVGLSTGQKQRIALVQRAGRILELRAGRLSEADRGLLHV